MNNMPAVSQSFAPFFDPVPASRQPAQGAGIRASIWAPQPQPSDTTWSNAIDTMSRAPDGASYLRPDFHRTMSYPAGRHGEDVFGPVGLSGALNRREIGTIGDGRRKTPPDFDPVVCRVSCSFLHARAHSITGCPLSYLEPQLSGAALSSWSSSDQGVFVGLPGRVPRLHDLRVTDSPRAVSS